MKSPVSRIVPKPPRSPLSSQNVSSSSKIEKGFDKNKLEKKSHGKNAGPKKTKFGYSVLRYPAELEKSYNAEHCERRGASGFCEHPFCCKKRKKLKRGPSGDLKNICEPSRNNIQKTLGQVRNLNPRPSASHLNKFCAKWQQKLHVQCGS